MNYSQHEAVLELHNIMQTDAKSLEEAVLLKQALRTIEQRSESASVTVPRSVLQQARYHIDRQMEVNR